MSLFGKVVVALLLATLVGLGGVGWYALPRDDVPREPDAVIVLGGAGAERTELGITLADRYEAQLVLSSSAAIFGQQQGRSCDVDAICFEPFPENTAGEAENVARLAEQHGWDHVTIATSAFHTSRSRYLFRQCLGRDRVTVVGVEVDRETGAELRLLARETAGLIAGATIDRAC